MIVYCTIRKAEGYSREIIAMGVVYKLRTKGRHDRHGQKGPTLFGLHSFKYSRIPKICRAFYMCNGSSTSSRDFNSSTFSAFNRTWGGSGRKILTRFRVSIELALGVSRH